MFPMRLRGARDCTYNATPGPSAGRDRRFLEAFLVSTGVVALAEIGDKTQLLALVLAVRYRQPLPIALGILVATLANHALAASLGVWVADALGRDTMRWIVGVSFLVMAAWTLIPDKLDNDEAKYARFGVFGATVIAFFLVEIGDKTQVATVALAARYASLYAVVAGTTLGMLVANLPVVYLGDRLQRRLPLRVVHGIAAAIFAVLGVLALSGTAYT